MIINGSSRKNGRFFSAHLLRGDHNERVEVVEFRGLAAETIREAFREMEAVASGTNCSNYFYHANLNPRAEEQLTGEQWTIAIDTLERELGLTDQPRFVVEHTKEGRTHRHVVWSRINPDTMTAISDSLTYQKHERAARQIEELFGHEEVPSVLVKDREGDRPQRRPKDWETFRAQDSRLDPKAMAAEITALWHAADSAPAFAAALAERGYILARGDRRDFVIIDAAGDDHSLARRVTGVKAAGIRARMAAIDPASLPSVEQGRALARQRQGSGDADTARNEGRSAFDRTLQSRMRQARPRSTRPRSPRFDQAAWKQRQEVRQPSFEAVLVGVVTRALITQMRRRPDTSFNLLMAFWDNMQEYIAGIGEWMHDHVGNIFSHDDLNPQNTRPVREPDR